MGKLGFQINDLLNKYAQNKISRRELDILNRLLKNNMAEDEVKKILDKHWKALIDTKTNPDNVLQEDFFDKTLKKAKQKELVLLKKQLHWKYWSRTAIVFIGLTISGILYFTAETNTADKTNLITYNTGIGERKSILLPDGSKVVLNSVSEISYPKVFNDTIREINLTGEAFFEVTRNKQQPFVITTRDLKTRVLGTSFNIKAYQNDKQIQVSVATGKVKIKSSIKKNIYKYPAKFIISSGEQAVYSTENGNLIKQNVNTKLLTAWRDGILIFEKTEVKEVIKTLARWYKVDIELVNSNIANCLIRSKFDNAELKDVLETLKFILNIEYEYSGNKVIFKGGACSS